MHSLEFIKKTLARAQGQFDMLQKEIVHKEQEITTLETAVIECEEAQTIIQTVAQKTQEQLKYHVSELVTLALSAVFDEPYEFDIDFVLRRGKTEADLIFIKDGEAYTDPLLASGGGAIDVASFALRISLWTLMNPRSRNVLILDEPFKFLSSDLQDKAALMLSEMSKRLDLQVIMVSHVNDLIEGADNIIQVENRRGKSKTKFIGEFNGGKKERD